MTSSWTSTKTCWLNFWTNCLCLEKTSPWWSLSPTTNFLDYSVWPKKRRTTQAARTKAQIYSQTSLTLSRLTTISLWLRFPRDSSSTIVIPPSKSAKIARLCWLTTSSNSKGSQSLISMNLKIRNHSSPSTVRSSGIWALLIQQRTPWFRSAMLVYTRTHSHAKE